MTTIDLDSLSTEVNPEELDALEAIEPKRLDDVSSPFANMLHSFLEGGGRTGRARVAAGEALVPAVEDGKLYGQDYGAIRQECLDGGTLWTDPEFPPDDASLYFSQSPPFALEWKRCSELSEAPALFEDGTSRHVPYYSRATHQISSAFGS